MKKLLVAVVMVVLVVKLYQHVTRPVPADEQDFAEHPVVPVADMEVEKPAEPESSRFRCDGRTHCSQMTSCAEAKFFLKNCPGTQMDGEGDGIPCERQWCKTMFSP